MPPNNPIETVEFPASEAEAITRTRSSARFLPHSTPWKIAGNATTLSFVLGKGERRYFSYPDWNKAAVLVMPVRELDSSRDGQRLRELMIALQNHERRFDPAKPDGSSMVQSYLARMLARCDKWDGKVFVAEEAGQVVGFVCVWARVPVEEPDDDPSEHAFVSDLVVEEAHRRGGLGRELLSAAEKYARARGARRIRLDVMARNSDARGFYQSMGYLENEIELEKALERSRR